MVTATVRIRRAAACLVLAAGLIVTGYGSAGALASTSPPAGPAITWAASLRTSPPVLSLGGVACPSAKICEAVGYSGSAGVILRTTNSGSSWSAQPLPARVGGLSGIACTSVNVCEAVGGYTNSHTFQANGVVLGTTNGGKTWRRQAIPPGTKDLAAVTCPAAGDCLAVGFGFTDYNLLDYGVVLGTTDGGRTWEVDSLPTTPISVSEADSVTCTSATVCYLGGNGGTTSTSGSVIFGTDDFGATWTAQKVPSAAVNNGSSVTGIACISGTTCEAVNNFGQALGTANAASWTLQPVPKSVTELDGLTCVAGKSCQAVGDLRSGAGAILSKTPTGAWAPRTLPASAGPLAGVACASATSCEAVGQTSARSALAAALGTTNGGTSWTAQRVFNGLSLQAVACGSARACEAVGTNAAAGVIMGTTNAGRTWTRQRIPSGLAADTVLSHVACPSATVCEAVGDGPLGPVALGTTNGGATWVNQTKQLPTGTGEFAGLSCASTSVCEAGGSSAGLGFMIGTTNGGKTWTFQFLNFHATDVDGLDCLSTAACTAVGHNGGTTIALQTANGGKTWTTRAIATIPFVTGLACATVKVCEVTGFRFSVARQGDVAVAVGTTTGWKASAGQPLPTGTTELFAVACPSASRCEAVGNAGAAGGAALGTGNGGKTWTAQPLPPRLTTLTGVSCRSAINCSAAGLTATGGGAIIRGS